ncbi:MAG: hypothetical protein F4X82_01860 [Candidatus Spechtbacteria bacterium SB0662_bin_43]|uniref:Uncharacterized protein n=1 Tax=Candidatus Spechtbacteria bacterium SB0662_bin_43 TaxID=2604897 RepID=A0A845DB26_9BACT|nr:hypothetical protein [Candidatus Spechtbacteria bacterium SB0662_bin_43]
MTKVTEEQIVGSIMNSIIQADKGFVAGAIEQASRQMIEQGISIDKVEVLLKWKEIAMELQGSNIKTQGIFVGADSNDVIKYEGAVPEKELDRGKVMEAGNILGEVLLDMGIKKPSNKASYNSLIDLGTSSYFLSNQGVLAKNQLLKIAGILYDKGQE